jgi:pyruvate-formate lyase-activating enzyme
VLRPTQRCNLSCRICYDRGEHVVRHLWPGEEDDSRQELGESEWKELIKSLAHRKPSFYITGGEPLLASTLIPIIRTIKEKNLYVSLNTNGVLLERRAEELLESGVDRIIVSLDGPKDTHDYIRGESFERLVRGIRAVQKFKHSRRLPAPSLRLQCVISPLNFEHLELTVQEAERVGCKEIRFQHPMFAFTREECQICSFLRSGVTRVEVSRPLRQPTDPEGRQVQALIERLRASSSRRVKVGFEPHIRIEDVAGYYDVPEHPFPGLCLSPWRRMDISSCGEMGPCQGVYVGRFPDTRPDKCWNGEAFRALRRHMIDNGLFGFCTRCCHREYRPPRVFGLTIN